MHTHAPDTVAGTIYSPSRCNCMSQVNMEQEMRTNAFKNELQKTQDIQTGNVTKELERQQVWGGALAHQTRPRAGHLAVWCRQFFPPSPSPHPLSLADVSG